MGSQRSMGCRRFWACRTRHTIRRRSSSHRLLDSKVCLCHRMVILQEGRFAVTFFRLPRSILACVRDVFNLSLKRCFWLPHTLFLLAISPNKILWESWVRCTLNVTRLMERMLMDVSLDTGDTCPGKFLTNTKYSSGLHLLEPLHTFNIPPI